LLVILWAMRLLPHTAFTFSVLGLAAVALVAPASARADVDPTAAVRGYFSALNRQDFGGAIALTAGAAQARTNSMVSELQKEAAAHNARVELKVTRVQVEAPGAAGPRGVPVPVQFHIDVVGHKLCFKKVARRLDGKAQFWIDAARPDRIVAIEGQLAQ
jgi:hypothetical protein